MSPFRRIWLWPLALAGLTIFGLIAALLGEGGAWWVLSWLALSLPLATIAICLAKSRRD